MMVSVRLSISFHLSTSFYSLLKCIRPCFLERLVLCRRVFNFVANPQAEELQDCLFLISLMPSTFFLRMNRQVSLTLFSEEPSFKRLSWNASKYTVQPDYRRVVMDIREISSTPVGSPFQLFFPNRKVVRKLCISLRCYNISFLS